MFVPEPITELIDELYASAGVEAVVVGGSRAVGRAGPDSDWDIGAEAAQGRFEIDGLPGHVAGIPTYSLTAEASVCRAIQGLIEIDVTFPDALREAAPRRWRFNRDFSLHHAEMHVRRGNVAGVVGNVARAVLEEAHARCCASATWVLNEKHVVAAAGLDDVDAQFALMSPTAFALGEFVDNVRERLHDPP